MTERDPNNTPQHDAGAKLDADKVRPDLIFSGMPRALLAVAEVATFGAKKYTENGWMSVPDGVKRYTAALDRHRLALDERDEQSGLLHAAHLAWDALARLELMLREQDEAEDDGPHFKYRTVHVDYYQQIAQMKLEGWYENGPVNAHGYRSFALEVKESPASAQAREFHAFERDGYEYRYVGAGDRLESSRLLAEGWESAPPKEQKPLNGVFATLMRRKLGQYRVAVVPATDAGRAEELLQDGWEVSPNDGPNPNYRVFRKLETDK